VLSKGEVKTKRNRIVSIYCLDKRGRNAARRSSPFARPSAEKRNDEPRAGIRYSRRDFSEFLFRVSFRACERGPEMYKKDRLCGLVGTCERVCLRQEELVLDRGLKLPRQHDTVKEAVKIT